MSVKPQKAPDTRWGESFFHLLLEVSLSTLFKWPYAICRLAQLMDGDHEMETDMATSGALQMVSALGCENITPKTQGACVIQDLARPEKQRKQAAASALGTIHSAESGERTIWDICKGHSTENFNKQMSGEWCQRFVAAQESCRTIEESTTLGEVHNALPYYTHTPTRHSQTFAWIWYAYTDTLISGSSKSAGLWLE